MEHYKKQLKVSFFTPSLAAGGAERVVINIANGLAEMGLKVDLVAAQRDDAYLKDIAENIQVNQLGAGRVMAAIPALSEYIRRIRPDVLFSAQTHANLAALWANSLAGRKTRVVVCEHTSLWWSKNENATTSEKLFPRLIRMFYPQADAIVAVSEGVAEQLSRSKRIPADKLRVIYNPIVSKKMIAQSLEEIHHEWFGTGKPPVVLGVGRLTGAKDFGTLLRAFSILRKERECALIILGEGEKRQELEGLAGELGISDGIDLHGFENNPFAYMKRAGVFVLSSVSEGLPTVLVEALACGAAVVSTDCPSGPREILEGGRFGKLVPVGNVEALAIAMGETLDCAPDREAGQKRAMDFSMEKGVREYFNLVMELVGTN